MTKRNILLLVLFIFTTVSIGFFKLSSVVYAASCDPASFQVARVQEQCAGPINYYTSNHCTFTTGFPVIPSYSCEMWQTWSTREKTTSCVSGTTVDSYSLCQTVSSFSGIYTTPQTGCTANSDCTQVTSTCSNFCDLSAGSPGRCQQTDQSCSIRGGGGFYCGDGQCTAGETTGNCSSDCPTTPPPPDFVITVDPAQKSITQGGSTTYIITVNPENTFVNKVALGATCPTNAVCQVNANAHPTPDEPGTVDLSYGSQTATLTVSNTSGIAIGNFSIDVLGIGGGKAHHTYPQLKVVPSPVSSFSASVGANCPARSIVLQWGSGQGANAYRLYRNTANAMPATPYTIVGNVNNDTDFPPAGSTYYYWIEAAHSPSGNYSAAVASGPVTLSTCTVSATTPNLVASSVTPSTANAGTPVTFSSTISNTGNASTGGAFSSFFQVATAVSGGGTVTDLTSSLMNTLDPSGASTATSPSYTFASDGSYSVRACADKTSSANTGVITESNESDNCGSWTTVTVNAANNASCGAVSVPTSVTPGQVFTGTFTVTNTGSKTWVSSGANNYHITVSPWASTWNWGRTPVSASILPGQSATYSVTFTAPSTPGTYSLSTQMLQEGVEWFGSVCNAGNITVSATPSPITVSISPYFTSITNYPTINNNSIYWTTTGNPDSCTASGSAPWGGSTITPLSSGSQYQGVYPGTGTYTYSITCRKAGVADVSSSISVSVAASATKDTVTVIKPIGGVIGTTEGNISCGSTCSYSYDRNSVVTFTATPSALWRFVGWTGACAGAGTGNCTITIDSSKSLSASFKPRSLLYQEF